MSAGVTARSSLRECRSNSQWWGVLETQPDLAEIPVAGTLCFVEAEWSFFARPIHLQDVTVTWPRALVKSFEASDALAAERITEVAHVLAQRLPPA